MKLLLVISSIIGPALMLYLTRKSKTFNTIFTVGAVIAAIIFGSIASTSVYQIIIDNAVFMTAIHAIFLNPAFLITGGYLGIFIIYRLIKLALDEI